MVSVVYRLSSVRVLFRLQTYTVSGGAGTDCSKKIVAAKIYTLRNGSILIFHM